MTLLSSLNALKSRTSGGNAVAADIVSGQRVIVNGLQVVGSGEAKPLSVQNGIQLLVETPLGLNVSSGWTPSTDFSSILVRNPAITGWTSSSGWVLAPQGWAYEPVTSYGTFLAGALPGYSIRRKHEMWGAVQDVALTNAFGVRILFNNTDVNNHWQVDLRWSTGSGAFYMNIWEMTAGVGTTRATVTFSTVLDLPARWHLIVYEQGDAIIAQCSMAELDVVADDFAVSISYSVANRPRKAITTFSYSMQGGIVGAEWLVLGCQTTDLL